MSLLEINKKKPKNEVYLDSKYLNNIGFCYLQLNQYQDSLNYYLKSLELLQKQKEESKDLIFEKNQALLYLYINYQLLDDKQKAEQYMQDDPSFQKQAESKLLFFQKKNRNNDY
ncbi:hypothetical protein ABPG72_008154 [Tetrahymena utriculariae]